MGIDIYVEWPGMTEAERKAQITGFSVVHGHVGYLREAYHGEPHATHVLLPEAFEHDTYPKGAPIAAATLRERLPETLETARRRMRDVYKQNPDSPDSADELQSFENFVTLCEKKEAETGEPVRIVASY